MEQAVGAVISAGIAASVAIITALITTRSQIKRLEYEQRADREREREKKRIQYLDPLVISATDLLAKVNRLKEELRTKEDFWKSTFQAIKTWDRHKRADFAFWCNGYGAGAVTTLYVTSVYFARASRIRSELPFIQLGPHDDQALLNHLTVVREAFGGEHNLWVEIQDSLGEYVTEADGKIMTYKGFCTQMIDAWDHIWFTRLIDFYRDIHMKQSELTRIPAVLEQLIDFAKKAAKPQQSSTKA
jgi:hypothetical protein